MNNRKGILSPFCFAMVILVLISIGSCRQDTDNPAPVIQLISPSHGAIFKVYDTIHISLILKDNQADIDLKIMLTNGLGGSLPEPAFITHPAMDDTLELEYVINEPLMLSGNYDLQIQASDGKNTTNEFVQLQIIELSREFRYPIAITENPTGIIVAYSIQQGNVMKLFDYQGDYSGSAINSAYNLLVVAGLSISPVRAFQMEKQQFTWSIAAEQNIQNRWFESIDVSGQEFYISYYEGYIKAVDRFGNISFTTASSNPYSPGITCNMINYLVASTYDYRTHDNAIDVYFVPGGLLKQRLTCFSKIVALEKEDSKTVLVFGNNENSGFIQTFDIEEGTLSILEEIKNDSIFSVAAMDVENYILAGKTHLYWFNSRLSSLTDFSSFQGKAHVACEPLDSVVYATSGKIIKTFTFPGGLEIGEVEVPSQVIDIQLYYNK
jgi:hypothetical protein